MAQPNEQTAYYLNGSFCGAADAKISVLDRAFLFGDAIYEVMRVHNGRTFRARDHYERMLRALNEIGIPPPFSAAEFESLCAELVRRNRVKSGSAYLQVSRGTDPARRHAPAQGLTPNVIGFANSAADLPGWKKHGDAVRAITVTDTRWGRCDMKTTMLLPNTLAKTKAEKAGAYEAIFVAEDGTVREGSSTGFFAVLNGTLRTHPANSHILHSVTRKLVLELAKAEGMPLEETAVTLPDLRRAEEAFFAGTTTDICPIAQVDDWSIGSGKPGPITLRIMRLVRETMERETAG